MPERDKEIRQIIDVLLRRRQNNPLLAGEPGVGKKQHYWKVWRNVS